MIRADISVTPRAYLSRNRFQSKIQARQWVAFEEMVSDLLRDVAGSGSRIRRIAASSSAGAFGSLLEAGL